MADNQTNNTRKVAKITAASSILFLVLLQTMQFIQPEFDPTWRFLSEYALGRMGWLMTVTFITLGIACVAGIALFWNQARDWWGRIGSVLLGITAIGVALAALFVTDPITTPIDKLSTTGTLHNLGAQLNLTSFAILFLTISLTRKETWKSMRFPLWIVTTACLVADVIFISIIASVEGVVGPGVYAGLFGRLVLITFAIWMVIASIYAYKMRLQTNK